MIFNNNYGDDDDGNHTSSILSNTNTVSVFIQWYATPNTKCQRPISALHIGRTLLHTQHDR